MFDALFSQILSGAISWRDISVLLNGNCTFGGCKRDFQYAMLNYKLK